MIIELCIILLLGVNSKYGGDLISRVDVKQLKGNIKKETNQTIANRCRML